MIISTIVLCVYAINSLKSEVMKQERIRRNLYKVLRKTGVPRNLILEDAALQEELLMDDLDLTCFLFLLETKFQVEIENSQLPKLNSVGSTIEFLKKHCA